MSATKERQEFQAEVKQLMDLMVHSLYSDKDIFLRELISNASDALDRLRYAALTDSSLRSEREASIRLEPDAEKRTLSIIDNGIGMSRDEVKRNIGTIAKSGTKEFLKSIQAGENKNMPPELIGQFGVGFYASFMVADRVSLITRKAGEETATRWESNDDGGYTIEETSRHEPGTTITLHLKEFDAESGVSNYTERSVLAAIVKKYSDFVSYPIKMQSWVEEGEAKTKVLKESTLNSMKAIWVRPKDEVTEEEYTEFYKHISHDWSEPLAHVSVKIEGSFEAQALLYVPATPPFDLYHPEMKRGVQLYVKRVFIMDECKELMPSYLRFVKGVVDAQDLSLNVSREILQKDRQIQVIRKQLVKKISGLLETMLKEENDKYQSFWSHFGPVLKEGLVNAPPKEQEAILPLVLVHSSHDSEKPVTLSAYLDRMKEGQEKIYYLTGSSVETMRQSPHIESLRAKGYEILFFSDHVDPLWLERNPSYREKRFHSVSRGDAEVGSKEEKESEDKERDDKERTYKDLLNAIRTHLQDDIKEVRLSSRLTSSLSCLVTDASAPTPQMEKLMEQLGQTIPKVKRILELNPKHELLDKMAQLSSNNPSDSTLKDYAELIYGQALLAEGAQLKDPAQFSKLVADLMVKAA